MPRIARVVAVGMPHHITQRGNYQQTVFRNEKDRIFYLSLLEAYREKYDLLVLAYCLMGNHVHLIVIPNQEDSMARTFNTLQMQYSQYINMMMSKQGHLWQGRYHSCVLDERHLLAAVRYIERNPVRASIVKKPWEWKWSSAASHIGKELPRLDTNRLFELIDTTPEKWKDFVNVSEKIEYIKDLRKHTMTGRPFMDKKAVKNLEHEIGREFNYKPRGRPWHKEKR